MRKTVKQEHADYKEELSRLSLVEGEPAELAVNYLPQPRLDEDFPGLLDFIRRK